MLISESCLITIVEERCHPEPVEGYSVKAIPTILRQAQHDTRLLIQSPYASRFNWIRPFGWLACFWVDQYAFIA